MGSRYVRQRLFFLHFLCFREVRCRLTKFLQRGRVIKEDQRGGAIHPQGDNGFLPLYVVRVRRDVSFPEFRLTYRPLSVVEGDLPTSALPNGWVICYRAFQNYLHRREQRVPCT